MAFWRPLLLQRSTLVALQSSVEIPSDLRQRKPRLASTFCPDVSRVNIRPNWSSATRSYSARLEHLVDFCASTGIMCEVLLTTVRSENVILLSPMEHCSRKFCFCFQYALLVTEKPFYLATYPNVLPCMLQLWYRNHSASRRYIFTPFKRASLLLRHLWTPNLLSIAAN